MVAPQLRARSYYDPPINFPNKQSLFLKLCPPPNLPSGFLGPSLFHPISGLSPACLHSLTKSHLRLPSSLLQKKCFCFLVVIISAASVFTLEPVAKVIS